MLLVVAAALILIGTLYPLFLDALNLGKISVGPPYFNVVFLIPMLPLVFAARDRHARGLEEGQARGHEASRSPCCSRAALAFGLVVPVVAYGKLPRHERRSASRPASG